MVFGTTVGLELGLLLLCYREGLGCDLWSLVLRLGLELGLLLLCYREGLRYDLWCLVLRLGLEHVPPEYQLFDRVTSSSVRVTVVNLRS